MGSPMGTASSGRSTADSSRATSPAPVFGAVPMSQHGGMPFKELVGEPPVVPSVGSRGHGLGWCKPCAFVHRGGCENGTNCVFCHLCPPGEKKHRKKEMKA